MAKELTKKQTAKTETDPNREQEIRLRAYTLYEERGRRSEEPFGMKCGDVQAVLAAG